jgi:hypothetical protein
MVVPEEGRGGLRASDADREQAIEVLKAAFVRDRLARAEFEARVGQALASRTVLRPDRRQHVRPGRGDGGRTMRFIPRAAEAPAGRIAGMVLAGVKRLAAPL